MLKKFVINFVIMVLFVFLPSMLNARAGKDYVKMMDKAHKLKMADRVLFSAKSILRHKDDLGITEKQEKNLIKMSEKFYEYQMRQKTEVKISRMKLHNYLREDKVDRSKMASRVKKISSMMADMQIAKINHRLDVKRQLTKDQIKKLEEIRKKRRKMKFRKYHMMKKEKMKKMKVEKRRRTAA